MNSLWIQSVTK